MPTLAVPTSRPGDRALPRPDYRRRAIVVARSYPQNPWCFLCGAGRFMVLPETARRFIVYQAASFQRNNGSLATRVQCPPCRLMNGLNSNVECGEGLRFPSRESPPLYMLRTIVPPASFAREQHKITEEARCDLLNT